MNSEGFSIGPGLLVMHFELDAAAPGTFFPILLTNTPCISHGLLLSFYIRQSRKFIEGKG
jgi:hypothetical protein